MDVKEFLLTNKAINLSEVAKLMWPENKSAKSYLSQKLHEKDNRRFTRKDAVLARDVLKGLEIELSNLTVFDTY